MYISLEIYILCFCAVTEPLTSYVEDIVRVLCWEAEERRVDVHFKLNVLHEFRLCLWCAVFYSHNSNVIYYKYVPVCLISIYLFVQ